MTQLKEGDKAPAFVSEDQDGKKVSLKDYIGNKVVLYFYPQD
ncbi:MAG: redoxin domain-containing protein, partial [Ginsengibacter sp.]